MSRPAAADPDQRLLEAELARVGDAHDLEDAALDQPVRAGPDGGLGHAQLVGDLGERAPTVGLEVLDDPLVERRELILAPGSASAVRHPRPFVRPAHCGP
jgi:hypothetical protein